MKIIILMLTLILLASCQKPTAEEPLSDETEIVSSDVYKVQIQTYIIYIEEGLTVTEFNTIISAIDDSRQTYVFTTNDGGIKTKNEIFEFDMIVIISESGANNRTYSFRYRD